MGGRVEIDNEQVRVTRWTLRPSEDTGQHRHEFDYVVVPLTQGQMFVANTDGSSTTNDVTPGSPYFRHSGAEHTVSNSGSDVLDFVEIEVRT
jgi:quercetin dioxygenase-like cupin family protein